MKAVLERLGSSALAPLLLMGGLIYWVLTFAATGVGNSDTYLHIAIGERFIQGWPIYQPGHFSGYENGEWYSTQWVSQILFAKLWEVGGLNLLAWVAGVLVAVFVLSLFALVRRQGSHFLAAVLVTATVYGNSAFMTMRPLMFSFILAVALIYGLQRTWETKSPQYWLVGIQWFWCMLHGMWILGLGITLVATVFLFLELRDRKLFLVPLAGFLVTFLTPLGWNIYKSVFLVNDRAKGFMGEWAQPDFTDPHLAVALLMLAVTVGLACFRKDLNLLEICFILLALGFLVYSLRTVFLGSLLILPVLCRMLSDQLPETRDFSLNRVTLVSMALAPLMSLAVILQTYQVTPPALPPQISTILSALPQGYGVYAPMEISSIELWRNPHLAQYLHGYIDMYTDEEFASRKSIDDLRPGWQEQLQRDSVDFVLWYSNTSFVIELKQEGWTVVAEEGGYTLLRSPTFTGVEDDTDLEGVET